ncbi:hypothetical protein AQUCO_00201022v1 [Aquilegia coerulea]|uniref:DUF2232 domain-containing protein n=1 Tax=Aquilegia coerulea TaxID=218851 RepID=A0A2G5F5V4_AQUCA|nr:hypothetical protein AQUCO_00201022v1 [Aquilegia coerulea]
MNLLKINPQSFHYYKITPIHSLLSSPKTPNSSLLHYDFFFSSSSSSSNYSQISFSKFNFRNPRTNVSNKEGSMWSNEVESFDLFRDYEDLATDGTVYNKTLRLVECSMFAAVAGLAYFLSNSLAIENYFGCFFALPIVISSMRWGLSAGRKTMVATAMLLLTLSGPVKASTYLLMHGLVGLAMGSLWRLGTNWGLSIAVCTVVRALGAIGYVVISSFLIRENILALITINIHASLTYLLTAIGVNTVPSMNAIYTIFGTLVFSNHIFCSTVDSLYSCCIFFMLYFSLDLG